MHIVDQNDLDEQAAQPGPGNKSHSSFLPGVPVHGRGYEGRFTGAVLESRRQYYCGCLSQCR
jgi:hypothetical protein